MHPLDDVVTNVHGVDAFGQQLHAVRVLIPGGFECLGPPARTVQQRGTDRLGCAPAETVIFGVQPADVSTGLELSPELAASVLKIIAHIVAELDRIAPGGASLQ